MPLWQRGRPLVSTLARVVQLTGATDLRNLEAQGELSLEDLLVSASDAVLDRAAADGVEGLPPELFERAVAFQFLGLLAAQGYLAGDDGTEGATQRFLALSDRYYAHVHARREHDQAGQVRRLGVPRVRNLPSPFSSRP